MPKVTYDKRTWKISLILDNDECPYLYFPDSRHCCNYGGGNEECDKDKCPLKTTYSDIYFKVTER